MTSPWRFILRSQPRAPGPSAAERSLSGRLRPQRTSQPRKEVRLKSFLCFAFSIVQGLDEAVHDTVIEVVLHSELPDVWIQQLLDSNLRSCTVPLLPRKPVRTDGANLGKHHFERLFAVLRKPRANCLSNAIKLISNGLRALRCCLRHFFSVLRCSVHEFV